MNTPAVAAVMVHVPAPELQKALAWYERAFSGVTRTRSESDSFEFLRAGPLQIEVVASDEKVASGPCGTIVYWETRDFNATLAGLLQLGANLYRGPLNIEMDRVMCQVQDPWGNCIGLRGKRL